MKAIKCKVKFSETGCFGGNVFPPRQTVYGIIYYIYLYRFIIKVNDPRTPLTASTTPSAIQI